jgi:hypothetical protein
MPALQLLRAHAVFGGRTDVSNKCGRLYNEEFLGWVSTQESKVRVPQYQHPKSSADFMQQQRSSTTSPCYGGCPFENHRKGSILQASPRRHEQLKSFLKIFQLLQVKYAITAGWFLNQKNVSLLQYEKSQGQCLFLLKLLLWLLPVLLLASYSKFDVSFCHLLGQLTW